MFLNLVYSTFMFSGVLGAALLGTPAALHPIGVLLACCLLIRVLPTLHFVLSLPACALAFLPSRFLVAMHMSTGIILSGCHAAPTSNNSQDRIAS